MAQLEEPSALGRCLLVQRSSWQSRFSMEFKRQSLIEQHVIDALCQLPLEPSEYCRRWVKSRPGKGYRKVCINALAEVTGLSPRTIKDWGPNFTRCPRYVLRLLRQADLINQFKLLILSNQIFLPPGFPHD